MENSMSVFLICFLTIVSIKYIWQKRYFYYYGFKIPGLRMLPIFGSFHFLLTERNFLKASLKILRTSPSVFRIWLGSKLFIVTSNPEDVATILNKCLSKSFLYKTIDEYISESLFTAPVDHWKKKRKIVNHSFRAQVINSYLDIFNKRAKNFVENLKKNSAQIENNLFSKLWVNTLSTVTEALLDVDPKQSFLENFIAHRCVPLITKLEKIMTIRGCKMWLFIKPLWQLSKLRTTAEKLVSECNEVLNQVLESKLTECRKDHDEIRRKRFLNNIFDSQQFSENELLSELKLMFIAGSETTASLVTFVTIFLGMHQDIQDKAYQEISTILENNDSDELTLEDLNNMEYMERIIKESLRIVPTIPLIMRRIDENIKIGSYVYPAGSEIVIPIIHIHNRPDLWPNPTKFDPDRFLPDEIAKRQRYSFLPFSTGSRNCIGLYYGLLSAKVLIVTILRNFRIKTLDFKSVTDIELVYQIVFKPKVSRIIFEKRS